MVLRLLGNFVRLLLTASGIVATVTTGIIIAVIILLWWVAWALEAAS